MKMEEELFLQANDFVSKFKSSFSSLLVNKNFVDVTLVCHDGQISAHKVILIASSSLFLTILRDNPHPHPLLYLKGVSIQQLSALLQFLYTGEVRVVKKDLEYFLDTAKELQIEGLVNEEAGAKEDKLIQQDIEQEDQFKSEPDIYDGFQYAGPSYSEEGASSENIVATAAPTEVDLMHGDNERVQRTHKGSTGGRLLRNPVWDYFVKLDNRSSCLTCGFSLVGYNTSSLIKHLENKHEDTHREYREKYQIAWHHKVNHQKTPLLGSKSDRPSQPNRVRGKLHKSPVHNFFTRTENHSNCNYCAANMLGHNPTTLSKHLESYHMEQYREFREMYRQAWENKRKDIQEKKDLQEDNFEQWNDAFEISYDEDTQGDAFVDGFGDSDNYIDWCNA